MPASAGNPDGAASASADASPTPMFSDAQLRRLKFAVIVMGLVLVIGFAVVVSRVVVLVQRSGAGSNASMTSTAIRPDLAVGLPIGAKIEHMAISTDRLAVHYTAPGGPGIRIIDLATGIEQKIILSPVGK